MYQRRTILPWATSLALIASLHPEMGSPRLPLAVLAGAGLMRLSRRAAVLVVFVAMAWLLRWVPAVAAEQWSFAGGGAAWLLLAGWAALPALALAVPASALSRAALWGLAEWVRGELSGFSLLELGGVAVESPLSAAALGVVSGAGLSTVLLFGAGTAPRITVLLAGVLVLIPAPREVSRPALAVGVATDGETLALLRKQPRLALVLGPEGALGDLRHSPLVQWPAGVPALAGAQTGCAGRKDSVHNAVVAIGADGSEMGEYHKIHLVPGFETRARVPRLQPGSDSQVAMLTPADWGILICFELLFRRRALELAQLASYLYHPVSDAWANGDVRASAQLMDLARLRAAETGLAVVRVSENLGGSGLASPDGTWQPASLPLLVSAGRATWLVRHPHAPLGLFMCLLFIDFMRRSQWLCFSWRRASWSSRKSA